MFNVRCDWLRDGTESSQTPYLKPVKAALAPPGYPVTLLSSFATERIAQAKFVAGLVVLTLDRIDRASGIKTKDFVGQVQAGKDEPQPTIHAKTGLRIHLNVLVEIDVSVWTSLPQWDRHNVSTGVNVAIRVLENIGAVVRNPEPRREPSPIVGWAEVSGVGRLPLQRRIIGAARSAAGARVGVAVVC